MFCQCFLFWYRHVKRRHCSGSSVTFAAAVGYHRHMFLYRIATLSHVTLLAACGDYSCSLKVFQSPIISRGTTRWTRGFATGVSCAHAILRNGNDTSNTIIALSRENINVSTWYDIMAGETKIRSGKWRKPYMFWSGSKCPVDTNEFKPLESLSCRL